MDEEVGGFSPGPGAGTLPAVHDPAPSSPRPLAWAARPAPSAGRHLPQLDALRGVAILAVFVQHFEGRHGFFHDRLAAIAGHAAAPWLLTALNHAHWGVDLFFVVSGFSLARGFLSAFARGSPAGAGAFLRRRAARIAPGYLVALAAAVAARPEVLEHPRFGAALLAHLSLLQGYVSPGGIVLIGASWSLTTEAHFYLLMPLLARPLLAPSPRSPLRPWIVGAGICLAVWAIRGLLHDVALRPDMPSSLLEASQRRWIVSRLDQFVLGALAAAAHRRIMAGPLAARAVALAPAALVASVALLLVGFRLEGELYLTRGGSWPYALISIASASLVLAAVSCSGLASSCVAPAPLRALGVISYGVFLYHQLAIDLTARLSPYDGSGPSIAWRAALALGASIGMGLGSWLLVERPALWWSARRREHEAC